MKKILIFIFFLFLFMPISVNAKRGCCSHHGGVAGCNSSGRQICKDGTLSPTCTCTPVVSYTYGCTDSAAKNYDPDAEKNDGSCEYYNYGCTDPDADNYDIDAEKDDGSCEYTIEEPESSVTSFDEVEDNEDDDAGLFVLGAGGTALGIWLYKKKKK